MSLTGNEPRESWVNPKVEIGSSPLHGQGMFAASRVAEGETVVIWGGSLVGKEEADRARAEGKVVMQLEGWPVQCRRAWGRTPPTS